MALSLAYFSSVVMCKPFTIPMWSILSPELSILDTSKPMPSKEAVFALKAASTQLVSISIIIFHLLPFYDRGFAWWVWSISFSLFLGPSFINLDMSFNTCIWNWINLCTSLIKESIVRHVDAWRFDSIK